MDTSYKDILDNLYDGVYFVDTERRITYWNAAAEQITGYRSQEVIGRCCAERILRHIDDQGTELCENGCPLTASLIDGENREAEVYLHHKDGHRVPVRVRVSPIKDEQGRVTGVAELFSNNGDKEAMSQRLLELEQLALLDELTRLANRRYLENSLENRIKELDRYQWASGLLMIDIDNFKQVNDTYGHPLGDEVLRQMATTLRNNSRSFDLYGRWGGEEFLGIIRNVDASRLRKMAEKIRILIAHTTVMAGTTQLGFTVSIGATLLRPGDTVESAVARADQLMYRSKKNGKNRVTLDEGR